MSAWYNSPQWRPPLIGWWNKTEVVPAVVWAIPTALGLFLMVAGRALTGHFPAEHGSFGLLNGNIVATLVWSPVWSFPGVVVALFPLRQILLHNGWFGWASALITGAVAGVAVPLMLGPSYWLIGPLYGAGFLWLQQVIYKARFPDTFGG